MSTRVIPEIQHLSQMLENARPVADTLKEFLRKVFSDKSLMGDPSLQKWVEEPVFGPFQPNHEPKRKNKPVSFKGADFGDNLAEKI